MEIINDEESMKFSDVDIEKHLNGYESPDTVLAPKPRRQPSQMTEAQRSNILKARARRQEIYEEKKKSGFFEKRKASKLMEKAKKLSPAVNVQEEKKSPEVEPPKPEPAQPKEEVVAVKHESPGKREVIIPKVVRKVKPRAQVQEHAEPNPQPRMSDDENEARSNHHMRQEKRMLNFMNILGVGRRKF